jgi:hypothetical protein
MGDSGLLLSVNAKNQGDETAHDIQIEAFVADSRLVSPAEPSLSVNQTTSTEFALGGAFATAGRYPIVLKTYYKDANGYQFSAVSLGFYDHKHAFVSDISINSEKVDIPVSGVGKLEFLVRNSGNTERQVELRLYIPNELSVGNENLQLTLGPKKMSEVGFDIENFSALENSTYYVYLIAQYVEDEEHYSSAGSAVIHVTSDFQFIDWAAWVFAASISVLIALILTMWLRRRKSPESA